MTIPRPEPFYFGDAAHPLAGWIHRQEPEVTPRLGVVLCDSLFHESVASHRTMRRIAQAAAARGIPAMRFDYPGTRDSSGAGVDEGQLSDWIDGVRCAIETMKEVAGVDQVCVLGLRVGASLAVLAAAGRTDVAGVVAISPVVNGRRYLRELRAFAMPSGTQSANSGADPNDVGGGFVLSSGTHAALGALDLLGLDAPIAPRVLLIDRNDLPSDGAWAAHARQHGSVVDLWQMAGFADMMRDPHHSVVPADMVRTVADWLADDCAAALDAPIPGRGGRPHVPLTTSMRLPAPAGHPGTPAIQETAQYLDPSGTLFGIVTEPASQATAPRGVPLHVIILLNAGAIHHAGPGRLYVTLARAWAAEGHVVLRVDLSGLGDSATRPGCKENVVYSTRANDDIAAALAFVRREYPEARCYVAGICSGAYHAFKAAVAGVAIDGVIAVNPLTFFWREGMSYEAGAAQVIEAAARNRAAGLQLETWRRLFTGRIPLEEATDLVGRRVLSIAVNRIREVARWLRIPLPNDLAAELRRVAQRRIDLIFVFSAGDPGHQMLVEQGGSMVAVLARRGALRVTVIEGADHVFTRQASKDRLLAALTGTLLTRALPPAAAAAPAAWRLHDQSTR